MRSASRVRPSIGDFSDGASRRLVALRARPVRWPVGALLASLVLLVGATCSVPDPVDAATIRLVARDGRGEGLFDPTPADPEGGNPGTTIGELRQNAMRRAAQMWADVLESDVEIVVEISFNPLDCDDESAVLGTASASSVHNEFIGAPDPTQYYVAALANSLAGVDLCAPGSCRNPSDIRATFSSSFGVTCEFSGFWYYGLDETPPQRAADLVTVALHELGHGLGFLSLARLSNGGLFRGSFDPYTAGMEFHGVGNFTDISAGERASAFISETDLHFIGPATQLASQQLTDGEVGGHVLLYAPAELEGGSSVSHFDRSLAPNQLMEPVLRFASHDVGLSGALLADLGWVVGDGLCVADCDADRQVEAADLVLAVRIALGQSELSECDRADRDGDGRVTISELIRGVDLALRGCGGEVIDEFDSQTAVTSTLAPAGCAGDCNGDGRVTVEELIRGVNIALGRAEVASCTAFDSDGNGEVSISELVAAVTAALNGCACPFDFTSDLSQSGEACAFAGRWNDGCGDDGLPATFAVSEGLVAVGVITAAGSPPLTFLAQPSGPREATLVGYMLGDEIGQLGGSVTLSADGAQLELRPGPLPDVVIDGCPFDFYDGVFARVVSATARASEADFAAVWRDLPARTNAAAALLGR